LQHRTSANGLWPRPCGFGARSRQRCGALGGFFRFVVARANDRKFHAWAGVSYMHGLNQESAATTVISGVNARMNFLRCLHSSSDRHIYDVQQSDSSARHTGP
jgi:hypothetical protein